MSQPVKLSDELVLNARLTGKLAERSIAGQIEFWARLGRAVEPLLSGEKALALRKSGDAMPLSEAISTVDTPTGRRRVAEYLESQPFPHYEVSPELPGLLVKTEENGNQALGKFIRGEFRPAGQPKKSPLHRNKSAKTTSRDKLSKEIVGEVVGAKKSTAVEGRTQQKKQS